MRVVTNLDEIPDAPDGRIVAIGNFDGVHLGHRRILSATVERAREAGLEPAVLTFDPHPTLLLRPDLPHDMLTTFEDKADRFAAVGMGLTVCLTFDEAFSAQSPETFVKQVLMRLNVKEVFVGANYKFGMGRAGDADALTDLGKRYGFAVHPQTFYSVDGKRVSSSRIRKALRAGDVAAANALLGHPYCLKGQVVPGARRGRVMGFPTANLNIPEELVPENGIYAAWVAVQDADNKEPRDVALHPAAVYVGTRPTFDEVERLIEVHLLEADLDLYGHRIRLEFVDRVRPEMTFDSADELTGQIKADVARTREILEL